MGGCCSKDDQAIPSEPPVRLQTHSASGHKTQPLSSTSQRGDNVNRLSSSRRPRPATAGPSSHRTQRPSSSRTGPSSHRERPSSHQERRRPPSTAHRHQRPQSQFGSIPEYRPAQFTEDRAIITGVTTLASLIDQHAINFYRRDHLVNPNTIVPPGLEDSQPIIRQRIARAIIDSIIMADGERLGVEVARISDQIIADLAHYSSSPNSNQERENHIRELCQRGVELWRLMNSHPSHWRFGVWGEPGGHRSGFMMVFPSLLRDNETILDRQIFRIYQSLS